MDLTLDKNLTIILGMACCLGAFSFSLAFAQNQDSGINDQENLIKLDQIVSRLTTSVAATLTGLTLAGGAFLVNVRENDKNTIFIDCARKNFVKAFVFFLSCLISIFVFDVAEILIKSNLLILEIDAVITYSLFGIGSFYLVRAARGIYISFIHN